MKNTFILIFTSLLVAGLLSCKDSSTEASIDFNSLTWTADTLAYTGSMQTLMCSIWGSSSKNIYACGHNERGRGSLYKFNGSSWEEYNYSTDIPTLDTPSFKTVYGFASNQIWAGGASCYIGYENDATKIYNHPLIIRYNGSKWVKEFLGTDTSAVNCIHGSSVNDLWACGSGGFLYNYVYSTSKWNKIQIFDDYAKQKKIEFTDIKSNGSNVYLLGSKTSDTYWTKYFIIITNNQVSHIDSFRIDSYTTTYNWGYGGCVTENGKYCSRGYGNIYEWVNSAWEVIYNCVYDLRDIQEINGSLIAVGYPGAIISNSSGSWNRINTPYDDTSTLYKSIWSDGKKVFIAGWLLGGTLQKTIILKGE